MDMNIDVKDLIAKLKSGGKKKDARGGNSLTKFFDKNPKMKIIIPLVFVLIFVAVAVVIIVSGVKTDTDVDENVSVVAQSVDILPQVDRTQQAIEDGVDPFSEDVIVNAKLKGVVYNSAGYRTAIVSTQYASYTLQVGDYVSTSEWLVEEITDNSITFSLGEKTRTIVMK